MEGTTDQMNSEIWWVTKVLVPLAGVSIASVIIPLLLHHLKYKRERAEKLFESRKEAYREYFRKIETAVSDAGQEYEKFSKEIMPNAFLKLLRSNNSPESIVEFQQTVGNIAFKIQSAYQKAAEEITSLQIECSKELLEMANEFESLNKALLDKSSSWIAELSTSMLQPNSEAPMAKEMQLLGDKIRELKKRIIKQMRDELGTNKF
jgi:hypothetical protein